MAAVQLASNSAAAEDGLSGHRRYMSDIHKNITLAHDNKLHWHMEQVTVVPTVLSAACVLSDKWQ